MLKFIRGKGGQTSAERTRLQKELFSFNKTGTHGFPHHPSALAYDHHLSLLAIGTRNGIIRIYGRPGVEFHHQLENETEIRQIVFIEQRAQLVAFCADSSLHLLEINNKEDQNGLNKGVLEYSKSCDYFAKESSKEGSLKQITTISINSKNDLLLIGTQSGNTFLVDIDKFDITDQIIYQDVVLQNVPEDFKFSPGSVEAITEQPLHPNKFLIGYNRGLLVLWDNETLYADHYYVANQQLESLHWLSDGQQFMSAHNDGSYIVWKTTDYLHPAEQPKTPYGPFPCKAIKKIIWKTVESGDDFIIFSGGMPRASYNDKNTVSIIEGSPESGKHHVLDFTSKVIDYLIIDQRKHEKDSDNPRALIVLVEEELVVIDLTDPDWLQHKLPYLSSVHSSAITCCQHYSDVTEDIYKQVVEAGKRQNAGKFTKKEWPINGGQVIGSEPPVTRDILVTGHEDGSVRFWNASSVAMQHLYTLMSSKLFLASDDDIALIDSDDNALNETNAEDEWPPFRKVGTFDPYSDDPRFAVRKVSFCIFTGTLVVGGTAGQAVVFELKAEASEKPLVSTQLNIVSDKDGFVWKGHCQLTPKNGNIKLDPGYQPSCVVQLQPPAAITALSIYSEWGLLAAGTAHGFGIFDYTYRKVVSTKSTLNPHDLSSVTGGDALISRRKSFKKSLRESFRRLRKGRSQRGDKRTGSPTSPAASSSSPSKSTDEGRKSPKGEVIQLEAKPVERQIEARSAEDSMSSMVRCLYFSNAFIVNNSTQTPTLWAATNAGNVYIFTLVMPADEKRATEDVSSQLAKEIHLKHKAPIVAIQIIDGNGLPLPDSFEVIKGIAKVPTASGHRVLICSEEQFKLFNLPNLKPLNKFKLTANEGARARRIAIAQFVSKTNEAHLEHHLLCLTNQGDIQVLSVPELKRQIQSQCTKREDINGISSLVFTCNGEGFYLHSSSEFRRFSLSARRIVTANCSVELPEGARPLKLIEERPPIAAASVNEPAFQERAIEVPSKEAKTKEGKQAEPESPELAKHNELPTEVIEAAETTETTPTSGIDESPLTHNEFEPEIEEIAEPIETIADSIEELNGVGGDEPVITNGNSKDNDNEMDNDSDSQIEADINLSNVTESSIKTNSLDITIDSVRDHLTNLNLSAEKEEKKRTPSPMNNDSHPIINSHED